MKYIFLISVLILFTNGAHSQDAHLSQFFSSPLTLNPANTGNFEGELRLTGNWRKQWEAFDNAYSTYTFSVDGPVLKKILPFYDQLSFGFLALSDQSGNGLLKQNYMSGSIAYKKGFDEFGDYSLRLGFQATYGSANFNMHLARFEDQLTPGGFLNSTTEALNFPNASKSFADLNVGAIYSAAPLDNTFFYLGASINHLTEPSVSLFDLNNPLRRRYNLNAGGFWPVGENGTLHTSTQFQHQSGFQEFIFGGAYSHFIPINTKKYYELYAGSWIRLNESIIPYLAIEWNNLRIGFSYDINYSSKKTASSYYRSGEFSIIHVFNRDQSLRLTRCPKF